MRAKVPAIQRGFGERDKRKGLRRSYVEDFAADVGPEFFHLVGNSVPHDEHAPRGKIAANSAIFRRVINVGSGGSGGVAENFGIVEASGAGVGVSDEEALERVIDAMRCCSLLNHIIAGILPKNGGENGDGHVAANAVIAEFGAKALAVSGPALSPRGRRIAGLAQGG